MNYFDLGEILSTKDHFRSLSKPHKIQLIKLVNRVLCGDFQHKELIPTKEIGSISIHSVQLKKWFRKKVDNGYYKKVIQPYFDCINDSYSFGNGKGKTKKYRLKKWVKDLCIVQYKKPKSIQYSKVIKNDIEPIHTIPNNGVGLVDINGDPTRSNVYVNPIVNLNWNNLENTIISLENSKPNMIRKKIYDRSLNLLYQYNSVLNNNLCKGGVLQLYQEGIDGRLNPKGGVDFPHIIHTPSRIRNILFSGMDLWDYDMSNSHLSLFYGLCERYGLRCPNIGEYLVRKDELRYKWSYDFNVKIKDLKTYIISWLYGNHINPIKPNPYYEIMGYDRLEKIKNDEFLNGLYHEIIIGRKLIVKNHQTDEETITNVMGKKSHLTHIKKKLCFILFGYEGKVLELVNEVIDDDMIVLIYDGWIGRKTDTKLLENHIHEKLGFSIKFDEEPILNTELNKLM